MNILLVLIPMSLVVMSIALYAFFWAVDQDQFDEHDTAKLIPLLDHRDMPQPEPAEPTP